MRYDDVIGQVAEELGLPKTFVGKVYMAYWKAVREHITSLPLKEDLTDEEFQKLRPNVNVPSLGKFNVTLDRYKRIKKSYKINIEEKYAAHNKD